MGRRNRKKTKNAHDLSAHNSNMPSPHETGSRRQSAADLSPSPSPSPPPASYTPPGMTQLNAAPSLEHGNPFIGLHGPWTFAKVVGGGAAVLHLAFPVLLSWGITGAFIFGGCCSNVFALETIIKEEPESGLLITFFQFILTALFTWPTHFSASHPPFFTKRRAVPLIRWLPNIFMFFAVNLLNNFAFGYNISVPVHIILRSGGSAMTMLVGYAWGKRYTNTQIFSVAMLTIGIIVAAMADARSKDKTSSTTATRFDPEFITGLLILAIAQLLSAIMGLYTQLTYAKYGSHWHENLFYSHFLSIPLFVPFFRSLLAQFRKLLSSSPVSLSPSLFQLYGNSTIFGQENQMPSLLLESSSLMPALPKHILTLALNALTQYVCIRGVNLLGAHTSALGVSIVLNVRKLVSLFASIWIFGNRLPPGVMVGAALVFGSAGVWAWEGRRIGERDVARVKKE